MKRLALLLVPVASWLALSVDLRPTAAEPILAPETFEVDGVHSAMVFRIRYADISSFFGRFNQISGTFAVDESDLTSAKFDLRVKAASVDSGNEKRDAHLTSPDFFSAKEFPEMSFVSKSTKVLEGRQLAVTGDLTLRGVTKSVTATVTYGGQAKGGRGGLRAGFDGKLTINREDFGITFGKGQLGEEVTIEMGLTGVKS